MVERDDSWLDDLYESDESSPPELDAHIRAAARSAVRPRLSHWYRIGTAALVLLAVFVYVEMLPERSPQSWDAEPAVFVRESKTTERQATSPVQKPAVLSSAITAPASETEEVTISKPRREDAPPVPPQSMQIQEAPEPEAGAIEEVIVTGSYTMRDNFDLPSPITVSTEVNLEPDDAPLRGTVSDDVAPNRASSVRRMSMVQLPACDDDGAALTYCLRDGVVKAMVPGDHGCSIMLDIDSPTSTLPVLAALRDDNGVLRVGSGTYRCTAGQWQYSANAD